MSLDRTTRRTTRREFLLSLAAGVSGAALASCSAASTAGSPQGQTTGALSTAGVGTTAWDKVVAQGGREGTVVIYGALTTSLREALASFEARYPIKLDVTVLPSSDLISRLTAERQANRFVPDVLIGPASQAVITLKPAGAVVPLEPVLMLPEVSDPSMWFNDRLWWVDGSEPNTTLAYLGYVGKTVSYNTSVVDPKQFGSFTDLLDPKWRGKIVAYDIRQPGAGGSQVRFMLQQPNLGLDYLRRLFTEMDITYSTDSRQMVDWLGEGRFPLGLWLQTTDIRAAQQQGLPVAEIPAEQFAEGAPMSIDGGTINLVDQAPHPNAATVFINWVLSREGQMAFQDAVLLPSLRRDAPKDAFAASDVPKDGFDYVNGGSEQFSRISISDVIGIVNSVAS